MAPCIHPATSLFHNCSSSTERFPLFSHLLLLTNCFKKVVFLEKSEQRPTNLSLQLREFFHQVRKNHGEDQLKAVCAKLLHHARKCKA
ncbi:hypothetical protein Leryth_021663 [Lithospermum erythrorhizon]|nr:hypothetical protein Leryth_021663 [Lithospermum erythrorhizon]